MSSAIVHHGTAPPLTLLQELHQGGVDDDFWGFLAELLKKLGLAVIADITSLFKEIRRVYDTTNATDAFVKFMRYFVLVLCLNKGTLKEKYQSPHSPTKLRLIPSEYQIKVFPFPKLRVLESTLTRSSPPVSKATSDLILQFFSKLVGVSASKVFASVSKFVGDAIAGGPPGNIRAMQHMISFINQKRGALKHSDTN
jgi:hypothetical protein